MPTVRPSIDHLRGILNPTQAFRWWVEFESFPKALPNSYSSDDINFRAESTTIPKADPTTIEITLRGHKIPRTGIVDMGGNIITLTCIETVDNKIANFVKDWREICWELGNGGSGRSHYPAYTEAGMQIVRLDSLDRPIWYYKLIGCRLQTQEPGGTLDAATADPLKPVLNIAFDRFEEFGVDVSPE